MLEKMSLEQIIYYYNQGWDVKKLEARVDGSYFAMLTNGIDPDNPHPGPQNTARNKTQKEWLDEYRTYPGYQNCYFDENGKFHKE
jgi:hypothetical protein